MRLTIAWVRRVKETSELVIASDSRLRSYGAMDQTQKIFPLRGDCALAFCGDADVAYPFFVQAASALNNFIRTRTRADDVHETSVNGRPHQLFDVTSLSTALSRIASASSFFSLAFSSSSTRSLRAWLTSRPPNFAFHA